MIGVLSVLVLQLPAIKSGPDWGSWPGNSARAPSAEKALLRAKSLSCPSASTWSAPRATEITQPALRVLPSCRISWPDETSRWAKLCSVRPAFWTTASCARRAQTWADANLILSWFSLNLVQSKCLAASDEYWRCLTCKKVLCAVCSLASEHSTHEFSLPSISNVSKWSAEIHAATAKIRKLHLKIQVGIPN